MNAPPLAYACEVREVPARPTLVVRFHTPVRELSDRLGEIYGQIYGYLAELGSEPVGPPFVGYYNMDMDDLDVEVGLQVPRVLPGRGSIEPSMLPAGQVVACVHTGPYASIGPAYDAVFGWIAAHGCEGTGVAYEFYLNDPASTPPEALETDVVVPITSVIRPRT
jgi:effector-binding domain-containing protein